MYKQAMPQLKILHPLVPKIENTPRKFQRSWMGKTMLKAYQLVPHWFPQRKYVDPQNDRPIKIVFSGMGDSVLVNYTDPQFKKRYGDSQVYTFSWSQYDKAMDWCQKNLGKDKPIEVYGYSWGSNAARKFINNYPGNIVSGHFLDPMRPKANQGRRLQITRKDVPITYTPAGDYKDAPLKTALFNALRYSPAPGMKITAPVENHGAVSQWLDVLDGAQPIRRQQSVEKTASLTYMSVCRMMKRAAQTYKDGTYFYMQNGKPVKVEVVGGMLTYGSRQQYQEAINRRNRQQTQSLSTPQPPNPTAVTLATPKPVVRRMPYVERRKLLQQYGVKFSGSGPDAAMDTTNFRPPATMKRKQINNLLYGE